MVGRDVYTANLITWAQLQSSYGAPTKREVLLLYQQGGFPLPTQKPVMHSQPRSLTKRYIYSHGRTTLILRGLGGPEHIKLLHM